MIDEKKQIEEMAKSIDTIYVVRTTEIGEGWLNEILKERKLACAYKLYNAGYRKIPEGAVVLTREEYSDIIEDDIQAFERDVAEYWACDNPKDVAEEMYKDGYRKLDNHAIMVLRKAKGLENQIKKETAREILKILIPPCKTCDEDWHKGCLCLRTTIAEKIVKQYGVEVEGV